MKFKCKAPAPLLQFVTISAPVAAAAAATAVEVPAEGTAEVQYRMVSPNSPLLKSPNMPPTRPPAPPKISAFVAASGCVQIGGVSASPSISVAEAANNVTVVAVLLLPVLRISSCMTFNAIVD